jgi:hypothetical protein
MDLIGYMKQRRRWFVGIRRLPQFLPRLWAFFWALGVISMVSTVASFVVMIPFGGRTVYYQTPRWCVYILFFFFFLAGMLIRVWGQVWTLERFLLHHFCVSVPPRHLYPGSGQGRQPFDCADTYSHHVDFAVCCGVHGSHGCVVRLNFPACKFFFYSLCVFFGVKFLILLKII